MRAVKLRFFLLLLMENKSITKRFTPRESQRSPQRYQICDLDGNRNQTARNKPQGG